MLVSDVLMDTQYQILNWVHALYPVVILVLFILSFVTYGVRNAPRDGDKVKVHAMRGPGGRPLPIRRKSANQVQEAAATQDFSPAAKFFFRSLQSAIIGSFIVNAAAVIVQTLALRDQEWWPGQQTVVYIVATFFVWCIVFISLIDTKPSPTWVHALVWIAALPMEGLLLGASLHIYSRPHHAPKVGDQRGGELLETPTAWEVIEVILYLGRAALLLTLIVVYMIYRLAARPSSDHKDIDDEQPLLNENGNANGNGHVYGTVHTHKMEHGAHHAAWAKPTETPNMTWYSYIRGFLVLIPYLWPRKSWKLQALAMTCILIMLAQRVINVFVPVLTGRITDALSGEGHYMGNAHAPWVLIFLYVSCRWLQGGQGLLGAARSILWIPVEQYSYRAITSAAFEHVHGLSAEFHTGKRTGELISALNKGSSINSFLEMVTFNVGPMIFDLVVAVGYLTASFDVYLGLVIAIVTFLYIYVTIRLASWRVALRRNYTNADREMEAVKNDSLHSWDTVKYFNAEKYEFDRYRTSIKVMQKFEFWVSVTLSYMNTIQGFLFMIALMIACFIVAFQVANHQQSVGKFMTLITYMMQLQSPLNFFGTFYRSIQNNLINAERMLELFKEQPAVVDSASATAIQDCKGDIVFNNVTFGYDTRKPALNQLSFRCAPGTTTALVGESGGGKTTIMRLIFRYYNPDSGSLLIDGKDVQDMTIDSLRSHIGVVPQDCNMFNESIMYNLRYANQNASDEEIYDACRAASIHERIMLFPDGYDTKVGERGVRLSGGERQRVAIARTILKNPKITLLDEATAALDTETEERIQEALQSLAVGRTMLIIAHRLSTITEADQILVLSGGTVVERGTHTELIEKGGKYASMWRKQSRAQKAAQEAEELRTRAKKALEAAEADSANVSEDEMERAKVRRNKSQGSLKSPQAPGNNSVFRQHKRVNFSQSSLGRAWNTSDESDGDKENSQNRNGRPPSSNRDGASRESDSTGLGHGDKPPGHP